MNTIIYSDSPEYKRMQREQRMHTMPSVHGACAVQVGFNGQGFIVERGKLSASMAEARRILHRVMEEFEVSNPMDIGRHHATLQPITAQQARALRSGVALSLKQYQADYDLIVQTCYEAISDCDDPRVRMQAAHTLHMIEYMQKGVS
jgi:hypothetical protein